MTIEMHNTDGSTFEVGFDDVVPPRKAAALLGVSPVTLAKWARGGKIRYTKTPGGHRRFHADVIRAALREDWENVVPLPTDSVES